MKTLKTLTLVASALCLSCFSSQAIADEHKKTSSLVISDKVFIPSQEVKESVESETDMQPITEASSEPQVLTPSAELTPMPEAESMPAAPVPVHKEAENNEVVLSWRGRSGELLQDVVTRWGGRAGYDLHWKTKDTSQLHRSFSYFGTYQDAVHELLIREVKPQSYVQDYTSEKANVYTGLKKND